MADVPAHATDADQPVSAPQPEIPSQAEPTVTAVSVTGGEASTATETTTATGIEAPAMQTAQPAAPLSETLPEPVSTPTMTAPEPTPAPEPKPEAAPPAASAPFSGVPELASTLEVPASATATAGTSSEGGEWDLLMQKLRHWLAGGQWQQQLQAARGPLSLLAGLLAVLLVARVYSSVLGVLDSLPLVPGLLELVGVIAVTRFSLSRLLRSEERRQVIGDLERRWQAFRGKV